jgi:DNA-binding transcriptional ArsR family regulator
MKVATRTNELLDYAALRESVLVLRAVNHPLRKKIMNMLQEYGEITVTDIYVKLRTEQSVASQHLAILRRAGVVDTDRQGKHIFYSLNLKRLSQINTITEQLTKRKELSL